MSYTLGIVEVHPFANEPANQSLYSLPSRRFGGKSLLEWVVRRVTDSQQLDEVVVLVADEPERRQIAQLSPPDVPLFVAPQADPLARFAAATQKFKADAIVRVRLSSPFIDPVLVDRLVTAAAAHPEVDYLSYRSNNGQPAVRSRLGVLAEWCRTSAIQQADREASQPADRNEVTRFIYSHPELFNLRLMPLPQPLDRDDMRLEIGSEEDWDHAQVILEALGTESIDWQRIAGLLDQQPALRERMATLNRLEQVQV